MYFAVKYLETLDILFHSEYCFLFIYIFNSKSSLIGVVILQTGGIFVWCYCDCMA